MIFHASDGFEELEMPRTTVGDDQYFLKDITDEDFATLRQGNHRYEDHGKIFHMAIIDYLQKYNCVKSLERRCIPFWYKA